MLCDICKKNKATFHIKNNINGIIIEKDVCSDCYNRATIKDDTSTLAHFIQALQGTVGFSPTREKKCSVCGTKLSSILSTLFVGCPNCYAEFSDFVLPSIKNIQNAVTHEGKSPLNRRNGNEREMLKLKEELNLAIQNENFDLAASISRQLKQLQYESEG